ncbi:hypothetical protein ACFLZN_00130 [Nanoarchaeota archaeon]
MKRKKRVEKRKFDFKHLLKVIIKLPLQKKFWAILILDLLFFVSLGYLGNFVMSQTSKLVEPLQNHPVFSISSPEEMIESKEEILEAGELAKKVRIQFYWLVGLFLVGVYLLTSVFQGVSWGIVRNLFSRKFLLSFSLMNLIVVCLLGALFLLTFMFINPSITTYLSPIYLGILAYISYLVYSTVKPTSFTSNVKELFNTFKRKFLRIHITLLIGLFVLCIPIFTLLILSFNYQMAVFIYLSIAYFMVLQTWIKFTFIKVIEVEK